MGSGLLVGAPRRVATLLILVGLVLVGCGADSPSALGDGALSVGFSPGSAFVNLNDDDFGDDLDGMVAIGAEWLRVDFDWSQIELRPGEYGWGRTDRIVEWAEDRGMAVLAMVSYTPSWARPGGTTDKTPPTEPGDYASFARAAAERYAPLGVSAWELWNEPNTARFWEPVPDPAGYMGLAGPAALAIREVDPSATVISAGLAPAVDAADGSEISILAFLDAIYAEGAAATFDAIAVHPYSYPALPTDESTAAWNSFVRLPLVRDLMVAQGDEADPIWLTEYGAPTGAHERAVSEKAQADSITAAVRQASQWPWVSHLFVFSYRDSGDDLADPEQNFGVVSVDRKPKRAVDRLSRLLQAS